MTSSPIPASFEQIALAAPVLQAIREIGYEQPSPIQAQGIPLLLAGGDLLGQAQTGTGKTAAFALPILSRIDLSRRVPQALVLAPTRELAIQVAEAFQGYARHLEGFHILPVYGGQGMGQQLRQLARGVHVIVGTPGRVMDHLRRGTLVLDGLQTLVLDEADEMLNMGFLEDVEWILEHTPPTRQIALFSATMPSAIRKIADKHLKNAQEVRIKAKTATVEAISQHYWYVSGVHKLDALTRILEAEEFDAMLVFVRTKNETVELAEKLEARGFEAAAMNGDMTQQLREKVIERLKGGQLDIVVATDVAARGLDVDRITHVINYDIPYDAEAYVHRIGRTGRAGRTGKAILFVAPREKRMLRVIEQVTRQTIGEMRLPSLRDIADRRVEQFKTSLVETLAQEDLEFYRGLVADLAAEDVGDPVDLAAAMAYLMHRERPLQAPAEVAPPAPAAWESRGPANPPGADWQAKRPMGAGQGSAGMNVALYRLDVGRRDGVLPKDIVGAIANETGLSSRQIGKITLYDEYSTVELPTGLPEEFFRRLGKAWLRNQPLSIRPMEFAGSRPGKPSAPRKPKGEKPSAQNKPKGRRD